jgi:hypothetical protein
MGPEMDKRDSFGFLKILYSTLLNVPPFRFHCVRGCGIKPRTIATFALAVRRSNQSARSHPYSARSHPKARPDLIHSRPDLIRIRPDLIKKLGQISTTTRPDLIQKLGQISSTLGSSKVSQISSKDECCVERIGKVRFEKLKTNFSQIYLYVRKGFLIFLTVQ